MAVLTIFGVAGWKNSGKTGLMERLVSEISRRGYSVSTVKHAHHNFDIDKPGKDSHRHRMAGAREVLLSSSRRWALMHELSGPEPQLHDLLDKLEPVDVVLVEGFKSASYPKIETRRRESRGPELAPRDPTVRAIACDFPIPDSHVPVFNLDDTIGIADFVLESTGVETSSGRQVRNGADVQCTATG